MPSLPQQWNAFTERLGVRAAAVAIGSLARYGWNARADDAIWQIQRGIAPSYDFPAGSI